MRVFICLLLISISTYALAQTEFTTVEEKVMYNKANGLEPLSGIKIVFPFLLLQEMSKEKLDILVSDLNSRFLEVVSTEIGVDNEKLLITIITEGRRENHEIYQQILEAYSGVLKFKNRMYLLK